MENEMAYIAGLMDGDGSFSISRRKSKNGKNIGHSPLIQLMNNDEKMIDYLKNQFGGYKSTRPERVGDNGGVRFASFSWKLDRTALARPFLEKVIPYLVLKKERAEYLLQFIEENPPAKGRKGLPSEVVMRREKAYLKMRAFNDTPHHHLQVSGRADQVPFSGNSFWAYLAGLMDTDGSFSIKREMKKSRKNPTYICMLILSMIDSRAINHILHNIPFSNGCVVKYDKEKMCYRVYISNRDDCRSVLETIIPHLRTKRKNAEVLLEFVLGYEESHYRRDGLDPEQLAFRENCYRKLILQNRYGVSKPSLIDLETPKGDKAEGESHRERLSEMDSKEYATV